MADIETGHKWWLRYVVVPLIGGGGIVAVIVVLLDRPRPPAEEPPAAPQVTLERQEAQDGVRPIQHRPETDPTTTQVPAASYARSFPPAYNRGTVNTSVEVEAMPFARRANIRALASADTRIDGGCMELAVTGLAKECRSGRMYRTPATGSSLRAEVRCTRSIPAGSTAVILASAPNGSELDCPGVDGNTVELWVEFQRE